LRAEERRLKMVSIFLLGEGQNLLGEEKSEQEAKANEILTKLGLQTEFKFLIRKEEDLDEIDTSNGDGLIIFPYCSGRFTALIRVADSKLPVIIVGDEDSFANALDTYEYLADHDNAQLALNYEEVKTKIRVLESAKWVRTAKVCVFGIEEPKPQEMAWYKNPMWSPKLNICPIKREKLLDTYRNMDDTTAENLAKKWLEECEVKEPSFEDIVKSARVYLAMKTLIEKARADAAYVLWCGQFTKGLETKMCFSTAKLADDGIPVGCWKGENLLPMLILHAITQKPVFVCEANTRKDNTITLRHCFAPRAIANCKYVLRKWRNMEHTVTGYCQLPKGLATLINCGIGDKILITKAKVLDCKDVGGENCRMTIWVELEGEEVIRKFVGKEFAMVYGDHTREAKAVAESFGLRVL